MRTLIISLVTLFSLPLFAAGEKGKDCLDFEKLALEMREAEKNKTPFQKTRTEMTLDPKDSPSDAWLLANGENLLQVPGPTESKSPIKQTGCEKLGGTGDLDLLITKYTPNELELTLDPELLLETLFKSLDDALTKDLEAKKAREAAKPAEPKKEKAGRVVKPLPGETEAEAMARALAEEIAEAIGDAFKEALEDPELQKALLAAIRAEVEKSKEQYRDQLKAFADSFQFTITRLDKNAVQIRVKHSIGELAEEGKPAEGKGVYKTVTVSIIRWGSDLPQDKESATYRELKDRFEALVKANPKPAIPAK